MNTSTTINPAEFTQEQKQYLQGFFAGIAQRAPVPFVGHAQNGLITNDPASGLPNQAAVDTKPGATPPSPISQGKSAGSTSRIRSPSGTRSFSTATRISNRPKTTASVSSTSASHVAPAQDSFMLRLRVPGGILASHQLRGLAQLAEDHGCGRADLTTRSNLQLREFQPRDIVRVLQRIQSLGLTSRGSGADNIRNITASPITGLDSSELLDVAPLAEAMQAYITNSRDMFDLPRKSTSPSTTAAPSPPSPTPTTSASSPSASTKAAASPQASTSAFSSATSPATASSPRTAASSFAPKKPSPSPPR